MSGLLKKVAVESKKLTPQERFIKTLSGATRGVFLGTPAVALSYGRAFATPYINRLSFQPDPKLPTHTERALANLIQKLEIASKRVDPLGVSMKSPSGYTRMNIGGAMADAIQVPVGAAPSVVAHEIGHATAPHKWEQLLRQANLRYLRGTGPTVLPTLLALSGGLSSDPEALPIQTKMAPYVGGGILAGILGEEARSNIRGMRLLKDIGHELSLAKKLKMFIPTSTYLVKGLPLIGVPLAIAKGLEAYNKAKQQERGYTLKELLYKSPEELSLTPSASEFQRYWGPTLPNITK